MWKNRTASVPPRPELASKKQHRIVDHPSPARRVPNDTPTPLMARRSRSPGFGYNTAATTNAASTRHRPTTPSGSTTFMTSNNNNGQQKQQQQRRSPSPARTTVSQQQGRHRSPGSAASSSSYFDSLARPRSAHFQLREEISSLRCRIQRTELQMRAQQAMHDKYQRANERIEQAKKQRADHEKLRAMRDSVRNRHKQELWVQQKEQQAATRQRMQLLLHEKHEEVRQNKERREDLESKIRMWHASNDDQQKQSVQELREGLKLSRMHAALATAQRVKQCRDEFNRDVELVTKTNKQYQDAMLERKRERLEHERQVAAQRRQHARQSVVENGVQSRLEMESALERAKKTEAQVLLEERRQLLMLERRLRGH